MIRFEPEGLVWMDGRRVPAERATVALTDPAVQAGLGVFETLAVRQGHPLDLREHLDRLEEGARRLGVALPARERLEAAAVEFSGNVEGGCGWLKLCAVRSGPCIVYGGRMDPSEEGKPVTAVLLPWRRSLSGPITGFKTMNYADLALGLEEARRRGADEGIWLNTRGHLAEACSSSLFVVRGNRVLTPSLRDGILAGITRGFVIQAARALGFAMHEGKVRLEKLETAREAFLASSVRGIRPLIAFENRPVGRGRPGPRTLAIGAAVAELRRPGLVAGLADDAGSRGREPGAHP